MSHDLDYNVLNPILQSSYEQSKMPNTTPIPFILPLTNTEYIIPPIDVEMGYDTLAICL